MPRNPGLGDASPLGIVGALFGAKGLHERAGREIAGVSLPRPGRAWPPAGRGHQPGVATKGAMEEGQADHSNGCEESNFRWPPAKTQGGSDIYT